MANSVPIHKKGDKCCIENYRPISLTCIVSKIFEKCVRDEILNYCKDSLHDTQHGFLPHKSCTTQMIPFVHDISLGLNACGLIDVVYFDFAKAFDSVNHDIILHKLKHEFGIDGLMLKFTKEYLKDRKQRVEINGKFSTSLDVKSGVPHGSILGPLLFILFINDMQNVISHNTRIALCADDTKIWRHIHTPEDHKILQLDIDALNKWAVKNKMRFHPDKCKVLSVNNFHKNALSELPFFLFPYELDSTLLDYCDEEKDLGIITSSKFNYKVHRTYILNKANTQFNLLRRSCHFVKNTKKRHTLYLTLIKSLFNHCSQVWNLTASETHIEPFENFQKRCVKWIHKESYTVYSKSEYLSKLKSIDILPMESHFVKHDLILLFKIIHELVPVKLPIEIVPCISRTRASRDYQVIYDRSLT